MIRPVLIAAALLIATPALAQEPSAQRYHLDLSVIQNGVTVVWTRTQILEGAPAQAAATVNGVAYDFEASLFTIEGDGADAQMMLEAHLARGETQIAAPRLTFLRGQDARIEVGDETGDVLKMAIIPIE